MTHDITHAMKIHGFTNERELHWLAEQAAKIPTGRNIVEIGCWKGRSTRAIADNTAATVYAVDTWRGTPQDPHFKELQGKSDDYLINIFRENMGAYVQDPWHVRCVDLASVAAADYLGFGSYNMQFDLIFIDAAHDYDNVRKDILAWRPLLAQGGLFCGHDFEPGRGGVIPAVLSIYPKAKKVGVGTIWVTGE